MTERETEICEGVLLLHALAKKTADIARQFEITEQQVKAIIAHGRLPQQQCSLFETLHTKKG